MSIINDLKNSIMEFGEGPLYGEMPELDLASKLQNGPTAAHRIETVQVPKNYAYLTCTTGSSAFQNVVGVTWQELPGRKAAAKAALMAAGLKKGQTLLVSYPPLMSVFSPDAIREYGLNVCFITRPSRDALLIDLADRKPDAVIGESSFLRAALSDAGKLGLREYLPENLILIAAGSPMDPELKEEADLLPGASVHDLYGCQEYGWLCMDGIPLRPDIVMMDVGRADGKKLLVCGGLPVGDCFPVDEFSGASSEEKNTFRIYTPGRSRMETEPEVIVTGTALSDRETVVRCARTILRCKARIVKAAADLKLKNKATVLRITVPGTNCCMDLTGPETTGLFDCLLEAQRCYQADHKADPVWNKKS